MREKNKVTEDGIEPSEFKQKINFILIGAIEESLIIGPF